MTDICEDDNPCLGLRRLVKKTHDETCFPGDT